ncbi:MAG: hypothetical protein M9949_07580, partial [Candidatus Kapabacteria bacterium]|nr:hypothetical protein [Candidatus Kapabacteria bacterium]
MKIVLTFLITLFILVNTSFVQSQTPSLFFLTKFNDVDLQNKISSSINLGDTLLFVTSENNERYLHICFDNK